LGSVEGFKKIIVTVDGSENSKRASRVAIGLAEKYQAELVALHVIPRLTYEFTPTSLARPAVLPTSYGAVYNEMLKEAEGYVNEVVSSAEPLGVSARGDILEDKPSTVEAIIDYASKEKADLIVTGTKGRSGFSRLLVGSVSTGVVAHAHCAVLVVR
jgi:nucleotide-binding universal stress UspA family protein